MNLFMNKATGDYVAISDFYSYANIDGNWEACYTVTRISRPTVRSFTIIQNEFDADYIPVRIKAVVPSDYPIGTLLHAIDETIDSD